MAHINKLEAEKIENEKLTDEKLPFVPFQINKIGEIFDFKLILNDGNTFNTKKNRGKVILINFWSWYCGFCKKAMPKIKELYAKFSDE